MFAAGLIAGAVIVGPLFFALGRFERAERRITHQRADIGPALKRSP